MLPTLAAQGLDKINGTACKQQSIVRNKTDFESIESFIVKDWKTAPGKVSPFQVKTLKSLNAGVDGSDPEVAANSDAFDVKGVPGQGNSPNPPSNWGNHFIVKANNKLYDPSYGLGPFSTPQEYEAAAFAGRIDRDEGGVYWFLPMSVLKKGELLGTYP